MENALVYWALSTAGKTTTLSILSGDLAPTSGTVFLRGISLADEKTKLYKKISFCPQFDPLFDLMTGKEHLIMFGTLRGIPEDALEKIVVHVLHIIGLFDQADKYASAYSGGNKRKLSLGIALLGDPKVIFLDEPSSGMDPGSRRYMWDVISSFIPGRSIILTTHSMEECEALCSRIGIIVKGTLRCIGSPQHLKHRYGGGYRLEFRCVPDGLQKIYDFTLKNFPSAKLLEQHGTQMRYDIPKDEVKLGEVFSLIESQQQQLGILDYSLSQTSLEQVFISVAEDQHKDE
eukprot:TRINITY_DN532_c0_g3_i5.p1 TRINITY_DN532_c0_g3~~TRINITY_DN532_c0_g3_i5.p1  ORF type:complete len:289 (-),score=50.48 TRINITY_DN532_c0_g3_i5:150-1016(-)